MGMTDPISDMLTRIRNAQSVGKAYVDIPISQLKLQIGEILREEGFIDGVELAPTSNPNDHHARISGKTVEVKSCFRLLLKYHADRPVIEEIKRKSRPGRRLYVGRYDIPRVYQGLGISILSTSKGLLSDKRARKLGVGGELLCTVF